MSVKLPSGHTLYERDEWHARLPRPMTAQDPDKVKEAFLHHTTNISAEGVDRFEEQEAAMKAIQDFHMFARGYSDIGYAFVVFQPYGNLEKARVFQGRLMTWVPAAQLLHNTNTVPISVFGNFQRDDGLKWDTIACIVGLLERINNRHPSLAVLGGHRDVVATSCPGDTIYKAIPAIARAANLRRFT